MKKIKKVGIGVVAATLVCALGCATLLTVEKMYPISKAIGVASALVANECDISVKERNNIINIIEIVRYAVPKQGETFEDAWRPIAQKYVDEKIAKGEMIQLEGDIVMSCFNIVIKSLDYIFTVRCPKAGEYKELTIAAISGFYDGFLPIFKPANAFTVSNINNLDYDKEAYIWLKQNLK